MAAPSFQLLKGLGVILDFSFSLTPFNLSANLNGSTFKMYLESTHFLLPPGPPRPRQLLLTWMKQQPPAPPSGLHPPASSIRPCHSSAWRHQQPHRGLQSSTCSGPHSTSNPVTLPSAPCSLCPGLPMGASASSLLLQFLQESFLSVP